MGGTQIHDFNPGIAQNGLFWTAMLDPENVDVDLSSGTATLEVDGLHVEDYGDIQNALTGYAGPPGPSIASFKVHWQASGSVNHFDNAAQKFRGDFRTAVAQIEYEVRTPQFDIVSAPLGASTTAAAQLGHESNGSFY